MSSTKYNPPTYPIPSKPSPQLKVVLDYFDCLKKWDLETLSQLSTSYFTQVTLPASLGIPARSKNEDIEFLHKFRDDLKGAPLEVCNGRGHVSAKLTKNTRGKIIIYDINESKSKIWVHVRALPLTSRGLSCIDIDGLLARLARR